MFEYHKLNGVTNKLFDALKTSGTIVDVRVDHICLGYQHT